MKIIYENCGVKNYMKEDQHSYRRNFCSCEKKAWKNSGSYGFSHYVLKVTFGLRLLDKKGEWMAC